MALTFDALVDPTRAIDTTAVRLTGRKLQQLTLIRAWLIGTWLGLCSTRDVEVVHDATAGDDDLFVSQYRLDLQSEETSREWLHEARAIAQRAEVGE